MPFIPVFTGKSMSRQDAEDRLRVCLDRQRDINLVFREAGCVKTFRLLHAFPYAFLSSTESLAACIPRPPKSFLLTHVEIYSMILEEFGYEPLPDFCEPPYSPFCTPELYKQYPFIMGAMRPHYFYQSWYRSLPSLAARQKLPQVRLHPDAARRLGVEEGEEMWLSSPSTSRRIKMTAHLDSRLDPRVVYPNYGWWYPDYPASEKHGAWESNINLLTDDDPDHCCSMLGGTFLNANQLKLEKI